VKNSKAKGNGFELTVAKMFTEWSGHKFMRTPMSGAIHNFNDKRVISDIVPPLSVGEFPFSIECKNQEVPWDLDFILIGTSKIWEFWEQASGDAKSENLEPLLVFKKNFRQIYAAMETDVFILLFRNKEKPHHISITREKGLREECKKNITIMSFNELLLQCSLDDFLELRKILVSRNTEKC
jgi:hypothetical protein